jgi:hypothetical protein
MPRHQRAVRPISAIGEYLGGSAETGVSGRLNESGTRKANHDQRSIDGRNRACNGVGERTVTGSHVVERTVGLHVLESGPLSGGYARESGYLIHDAVFHLAWGETHLASTETWQVGKTRVRPNGDAVLAGQSDGFAHDTGVAGVEAAR